MNHSDAFWKLVAIGDPQFKQHRKLLRMHSPTL
jgi:predicted metal-dependent hydrolase